MRRAEDVNDAIGEVLRDPERVKRDTRTAVLWLIHNKHANPRDAEDAAQEAWQAAVTDRSQFRGEAAFRSYLLQIAKNKLRDIFKHRGRSRPNEIAFARYGSRLDKELRPEVKASARAALKAAVASARAEVDADSEDVQAERDIAEQAEPEAEPDVVVDTEDADKEPEPELSQPEWPMFQAGEVVDGNEDDDPADAAPAYRALTDYEMERSLIASIGSRDALDELVDGKIECAERCAAAESELKHTDFGGGNTARVAEKLKRKEIEKRLHIPELEAEVARREQDRDNMIRQVFAADIARFMRPRRASVRVRVGRIGQPRHRPTGRLASELTVHFAAYCMRDEMARRKAGDKLMIARFDPWPPRKPDAPPAACDLSCCRYCVSRGAIRREASPCSSPRPHHDHGAPGFGFWKSWIDAKARKEHRGEAVQGKHTTKTRPTRAMLRLLQIRGDETLDDFIARRMNAGGAWISPTTLDQWRGMVAAAADSRRLFLALVPVYRTHITRGKDHLSEEDCHDLRDLHRPLFVADLIEEYAQQGKMVEEHLSLVAGAVGRPPRFRSGDLSCEGCGPRASYSPPCSREIREAAIKEISCPDCGAKRRKPCAWTDCSHTGAAEGEPCTPGRCRPRGQQAEEKPIHAGRWKWWGLWCLVGAVRVKLRQTKTGAEIII